jgi:type I restriction-modification system DNA methylase subunit
MESIQAVLKAVLDAHVGDPQLLAVQLKASPVSVQRWLSGDAKPRPAYEAKLRTIHAKLVNKPDALSETPPAYRVTPHHPMITEAVDQTLRSIREVLHKRGRLSSRSQALDELSKLMFAHVRGVYTGRGGISKRVLSGRKQNGDGLAAALKTFVDEVMRESLPESLAHEVDLKDFELKLKPQEEELALELVECFETLHRQTSTFSFSGFDVLNEVFGKFLNDSFIDEKELGQYLTPPEVVRFMVDLAIHQLSADDLEVLSNPKRCTDFGIILDPSCGVASFLLEFVHVLQTKLDPRMPRSEMRTLWLQNMLGRVLVGIDKSERMVRLALTNAAMFGFPAARLHLANALARNGSDGKLTESLGGKAKLILTNPPFGATFHGNDLVKYQIATSWSRRFPGRLDSELLFMERYLEWLAPGGQLVAIVPDSILTNKAVFEDLRRAIADKIDLLNVVSLPSVTFGTAGTTTKTSVLHVRKKERRNGNPVRTGFAICQDIGFTVSTKANQRVKVVEGQGDLPAILSEIITPPVKPKFVKWLDDATTFERWDAQHHASLSVEIERRLERQTDFDLLVADVAQLIDDRADPRRWATKEFNYIEISDIDLQTCTVYSNCVDVAEAPSRARKQVRSGDVLVSTVRPERGAVGVVGSHQDGSVCTTGLAVLRPTAIDPLTLAFLLKTEFVIAQLMRNNVGIAYPAIDEACLLDLLLPVRREELSALEQQASELKAQQERLYGMRKEFNKAIESAGTVWRNGSPTAGSKPHPASRTTSRRQSNKVDSDSHEPDIFLLAAGRKV